MMKLRPWSAEDLFHFPCNRAPEREMVLFLEVYSVEVARADDVPGIEEMAAAQARRFLVVFPQLQ